MDTIAIDTIAKTICAKTKSLSTDLTMTNQKRAPLLPDKCGDGDKSCGAVQVNGCKYQLGAHVGWDRLKDRLK